MKRVMEAKVSQGLEKEQMGEQFTLIDPARLPEKPVKPNVPAVLLIGLFLGIGAGVGNVSLKEASDQSVRNAGQLTRRHRLSCARRIPWIVTEDDRRRRRARRIKILITLVVAVAAMVLLFHFFVMDLEVLWARLRKAAYAVVCHIKTREGRQVQCELWNPLKMNAKRKPPAGSPAEDGNRATMGFLRQGKSGLGLPHLHPVPDSTAQPVGRRGKPVRGRAAQLTLISKRTSSSAPRSCKRPSRRAERR